ncbi:MAG: class I SAM-dependent methyltransferase [Burkholderiales bacterium]|nr:class I SAM-dependent methyltransferase [Burkholderiales bacterium]
MALIDACPLECGAGLASSRILLAQGPLHRCSACGQLVSRVDAERYRASMSEFDHPRGTAPDERSAQRRRMLARRRLQHLAAWAGKTPATLELLDVGCSSGAFLLAARDCAVNARGVEPAPSAAASARAAGLDVFTGTLEQAAFPAASFDAVTLFEVIEHLPRPLPLLRECHRILRPGGMLLIGTGNTASWTVRCLGARWDYFHIERHGGHVSFFSIASMHLAAQRTGFEVARIETRNVNLQDRFQHSRPAYRLAKLIAQALNAPARWLGRGHDMLAYLRKPGRGASSMP